MKKHFNEPLKMFNEDEENFKKADNCHICDKNILLKTSEKEIIVISLVNTVDLVIRTVI